MSLATLVQDTLAVARRLDFDAINVSIDIPKDAVVRGSRDELQQVFLNLMMNARDAMVGGGELEIRGAIRASDHAMASHLAQGPHVELTVRDTGSGMDEATLARIFEPFFTTKPVGKGNGLGLAMIYSSIRNHNGAVFVESTVGQGTTFRIFLPLAR